MEEKIIRVDNYELKLYPNEKILYAGRVRVDNIPYLAVLLSRDGREVLEFHRLEKPFTTVGWEIYRPSDETIKELEKIGFKFSESFKKRRVREILPGGVVAEKISQIVER
jgi:hypothetical protein